LDGLEIANHEAMWSQAGNRQAHRAAECPDAGRSDPASANRELHSRC